MNKPLRKYSIKRLAILVLSTTAAALSLNYASGPGSSGSRVGASFSTGTCTASGCHTVAGSFNPSVSLQLLSGSTPVTSYTPGNSYTLRVTLTGSNTNSSTRYGFQTVAVQSTNNNAVNAWGTLPSGTRSITIGGRTHVEHNTPSTSNTFSIPWTAPANANYNITFYVAGLVANGNNASNLDNMATTTLTVTPPCSTPGITPNASNIACFGQSNGSITLSLSGGSNPFTFAWTGPNSYNSTSQNINGLAAGTYKVVVTATGGCKDSTTVTITQPSSAVSVSGSSNGPLCAGSTLQLTSNGSGGTGAITYGWTGPNGYTSGSKDNTITNVTTSMNGLFTVTATDANGCTAQQNISVDIDTVPTVDSFTTSASPYNVVTFTAVNSQGADSTLWIFGDGGSDTAAMPTHTYAAYTVMLIVKNRCGSDTFTQNISIQPVSVQHINGSSAMFNMYPNPANNVVRVEVDKQVAVRYINMYTLTGQSVYTSLGGRSTYSINTKALPQGVYYISVGTDEGVLTRKLEILR